VFPVIPPITPLNYEPTANLPGLSGVGGITTDFDLDTRCLPTMGAQENLTPVTVIFDPTTSTRCQGELPLTVTYLATATNSSGITYSVLPAAAGTIDPATGVMTWNPAFTGVAVITATALGCPTPATATFTVTVTATPATGLIWHR